MDCIALGWMTLNCITLQGIELDCIALHRIALDCIGLHWIAVDCIALDLDWICGGLRLLELGIAHPLSFAL